MNALSEEDLRKYVATQIASRSDSIVNQIVETIKRYQRYGVIVPDERFVEEVCERVVDSVEEFTGYVLDAMPRS